MKKLILFAGACAIASAGSVYADEVDFRAANPVLQSLLETATSADDLVDYAYPRFDESFSDFKAEKLKYDGHGSIKNTPWLQGGHAEATATSRYWTDRTVGHTGIKFEASGTVRTEVLPLIRYSANIATRKTPANDMEPQFYARYQAHLKRLAVAKSLEEVYQLLLSGQRLARDMINREVEEQIERLKCIESGTCSQFYDDLPAAIARQKKQIADFRNTLPAYDRATFTAKTEGGKVREISICSEDIGLFIPAREKAKEFYVIPGKGCGILTDITVSATLEAFHKVPLADLDSMKKDFESRLIGVQNGVKADKDHIQDLYRKALIGFKKTIRGEW